MRIEILDKLESRIGREAREELSSFLDTYNEGVYIWLAGLYEPSLGGFYYSNSAKYTEGYLPDLESTMQALRLVQCTGLLSARGRTLRDSLPEKMRISVASFVQGLQSPEDGYFYHPQWGRRIGVPRRSRDNTWGLKLLEELGYSPLYPTALERLSGSEKPLTAPAHLRSLKAFKEYLAEFDLENKSYSTGNILQAQATQIKVAGKEYVDALFDWLNSERKQNGLWENEINYASVNGLMKLMMIYVICERPLPNALAALNAATSVAISKEPITFCCQYYNPLVAINMILNNMKQYGSADDSARCRERILDNAAELIRVTRRKVSLCLKPDGSFSYNTDMTAARSQGAPTALENTNEGDINATQISIVGALDQVFALLGYDSTPIFSREDSELFFELLESRVSEEKINPRPDFINKTLAGYKII